MDLQNIMIIALVLFNLLVSALTLSSFVNKLVDELLPSQTRKKSYERKAPTMTTYDFIVVGASPSGCVIANRLTEDPRQQVLLVEAGEADGHITDIPVIHPYLVFTGYNWNFTAEPNPGACWGMEGGLCPWPAGKGTGGGTIINSMIWTRGNYRDFDSWAAEGNTGWSYNDVVKYFKRSEDVKISKFRDSIYRGKDGNLTIDYTPYTTRLLKAFLDAGQSLGFKVVDYNDPNTHIGIAQLQATIKEGRKETAAGAFILPFLYRKNLYISLESRVTKINIDPVYLKATGIEYVKNGRTYKVFARKEVIISAGAFNSPQVLMLSGIGPADHLKEVGIPVLVDLPVGENLQEHVGMHGLSFLINTTDSISPLDPGLLLVGLVKSLLFDSGPLTSLGAECLAFGKTKYFNSSVDRPDIEILMVASGLNTDKGLLLRKAFGMSDDLYESVYSDHDGKPAFGLWVMGLYPESRGCVKLKDKNPMSNVRIFNNFLDCDRDIKILVEALKLAEALAKTPAFQKFGARLIDNPFPQCRHLKFGSDEYWECTVRTFTCQWHHQCGTCKMGTVVDSRLRVLRVTNLRVADTSIMPTITGGHIQAPAYMIGEKAADMIREDWNIPFNK